MQIQSSGVISLPCSVTLAPYLRVVRNATNGLALAGPEDKELGSLEKRHIVSGVGASESASVVSANAQGTVKMVAAGAVSAFDYAYGAEGGKVDDTANTNPIGVFLEAATTDGDYVEVLRLPGLSPTSGDEVGGLDFKDDFIGDYPAAGTALNSANGWTKVETLGLGVTGSDQANGVLIFAFDAVAEAATAALYMANAPFDIDQNPIFICTLAIYDIGDDAALDINFGLADDTHATDFDSVTVAAVFHLDGADLSLCCESDDGTTEVAATDTTVDLVDDTWYDFKIDVTDKADVKFYYRAVGTVAWTRLLASTTFDISAYTGSLTPIWHIEKTSNDSTADVRLDFTRVRCERA